MWSTSLLVIVFGLVYLAEFSVCLVGTNTKNCGPSGPKPICPLKCNCGPRRWRRVTRSMVHSTYKIGVVLSYTTTGGGLVIQGDVYNNGCGKGPGSGAVTYIRGDWTQIRYTQEFSGSASCWKIFGETANPTHRKDFAFSGDKLNIPTSNLEDFSEALGDGIFNEDHMNSRTNDKFDGDIYRCDNTIQNFWHSLNGGGMRRATVMLRRSSNGHKAGILTETSCGRPKYVIKDIYILI